MIFERFGRCLEDDALIFDGLKKAGLTGALLATMSLWFFLRRMDSTVIVAMSIPFSIIATCGVLYFTGGSLNVLSMMGLMLAVGMLVDNAIVVLESVDRRLRDDPDRKRAALTGALAMEYVKEKVRINAIAPGGVKTPMTSNFELPDGVDYALMAPYMGFRDMAEPGDIANVFAFLASDEAANVHGAIWSADN